MEQVRFTTRVLGSVAAFKLEKRQVTQTLRAGSSTIAASILSGLASSGDQLEVILDGIPVGRAELIYMDAVAWEDLNLKDAHRGGFDTLADMEQALKRAGYRFMPLNEYELFRIQFSWLEGAYA